MKSITTLFIFTAGLFFNSTAQDLSKYEKIYYQDSEELKTMTYNLQAKNVVATKDYCKLGLDVENPTNDFLMVDLSASVFHFAFGDRKTEGKTILIDPNSSKTKTLDVKGGDQFRQPDFKLTVGGLSKIPAKGIVENATDFKLPPASNSFTAGNFEVTLKKYTATTKEAKAIFECTYVGDAIGLVSPSKLSVKANNKKTGEEVVYANFNTKDATKVLMKGDKTKMTAVFNIEGRIVDMQFATMYIMWNDTFVESEKIPLPDAGLVLTIDQPLTDAKK